MAFTYAVSGTIAGTGSKTRVYGTYTSSGGGTGGDIVTNLYTVEDFRLQPKGAAVIATQSVVNETLPLTNTRGTVTIVTSADEAGFWEAWGY